VWYIRFVQSGKKPIDMVLHPKYKKQVDRNKKDYEIRAADTRVGRKIAKIKVGDVVNIRERRLTSGTGTLRQATTAGYEFDYYLCENERKLCGWETCYGNKNGTVRHVKGFQFKHKFFEVPVPFHWSTTSV